jgi:hypothetical protein
MEQIGNDDCASPPSKQQQYPSRINELISNNGAHDLTADERE